MSPLFYYILHVISLLVLTGYTFYAFAAPPETKKKVMAITGIASLVALIAGFGLQAKVVGGFPGWLIVKMVCWFGLSGLAGMGYRKRGIVGGLAIAACVLVTVAVIMVYLKPF